MAKKKKIFFEYLFLNIKNIIVVIARKSIGIIKFLNWIASMLILIPALSTLFNRLGFSKILNVKNEPKITIITHKKIKELLTIFRTRSFPPLIRKSKPYAARTQKENVVIKNILLGRNEVRTGMFEEIIPLDIKLSIASINVRSIETRKKIIFLLFLANIAKRENIKEIIPINITDSL